MKISELIEWCAENEAKDWEVVIDTCEGSYLSICSEYLKKDDKINKIVINI
jgi:hypothetical protein